MHFAKSTYPSGNNALIPKVSAYPSKCFPKLPIVPFQFFIKKRKKMFSFNANRQVYAKLYCV